LKKDKSKFKVNYFKAKDLGDKTMTYQEDDTANEKIYELILKDGIDGLVPAIQLLLNEAMKLERNKYLGGKPYERLDDRTDYANGFKNKTLALKSGIVDLNIPQVRQGGFYPSILEKGIRSERALKVTLADMYVQGVSTRKVKKIMEKLCGFNVSSTSVSRAAKLLDEELDRWRNRELGSFKYIYFDARYEKVRIDKQVRDSGILIAIGIDEFGKRDVLGVSVELSEAEVHWRKFMESLTKRGLHGIELITSDAHSGMKAARKAVFPSVPWQRCQFHLQQNAQKYIPKKSMKKGVAFDIRSVFDAPNLVEAERLLKLTVKKYESIASNLADWMESNIPEGFSVFAFSQSHWKRIRTSNMLERLNREIKKRTRVVGIFPNEDSALRLISAMLMETSEEWSLEEQRYLKFEDSDG